MRLAEPDNPKWVVVVWVMRNGLCFPAYLARPLWKSAIPYGVIDGVIRFNPFRE